MQTSQAHPCCDTLTVTCVLRSTKVNASVTNTGKDDPKDSTVCPALRHSTWIDWFERPDMLTPLELEEV